MDEQNNEQVQAPETNYVEVIKNLKANTVNKSEYERVLNENKTLAEALATSPGATVAEEVKPEYTQDDINNLSDKLINNKHLSNLDFVNTMLEYRDAVMEIHGVDVFMPTNNGYVANEYDIEQANNIADGLRQMAEYAGKDSKLFNSELKRCCK